MIADKVLNALAFDDIFVFDVHGHIGGCNQQYMGRNTGDEIVKTLDAVGVNGICLSSTMAIASDFETGNCFVLENAQKYHGRIYGYVSPSPYYEYDMSKYFKKDNGILGIKIHALMQKSSINNEKYFPAYDYADKNGLPILFHTWTAAEVKMVAEIAEKYKNAYIIIAHSGMTDICAKKAAIEAIKKYDNVFVDTAISSTYDGAIEWIVSKVSADRVVYGSDLPYFDCRHTLGKIALADISEQDKIKILGQNAKKIFADLED